MSSLLHTAITNRQAAARSPGRGSPSAQFAKLAVSSDDDDPRSEGDDSGEFVEAFDDDDDDDDDDELVDLQTRPGTPIPGGTRSAGIRPPKLPSHDPLRILPAALAVRVFLQLDIKSLARCNRVCKRWRKSSTLNYTWFLHCRALTLPKPTKRDPLQGGLDPDDPESGYDPYLKHRGLPILSTPVPTSATPQWSKRESKKHWRPVFKDLATRSDTDMEKRDPLQVDVDALSATVSPGTSGYSTPTGGNGSDSGIPAPSKSKKEMRALYKTLNGRKSKSKGMLGGVQRGHKDLGGAGEGDDPYSAPF